MLVTIQALITLMIIIQMWNNELKIYYKPLKKWEQWKQKNTKKTVKKKKMVLKIYQNVQNMTSIPT